MIIAHYAHRLPADYDAAVIRRRAEQRGPLWNATPNLYFKAFLLRERGIRGATASRYASLYLWRDAAALGEFLQDGRLQVVTESFGRPEIETRFALDARLGPGRAARFAHRKDIAIGLDADLSETFADEVARNRQRAEQSKTVAAVVGIDPQTWTLTRIVLSEEPAADEEGGTSSEILHLAAPLLDTLPPALIGA